MGDLVSLKYPQYHDIGSPICQPDVAIDDCLVRRRLMPDVVGPVPKVFVFKAPAGFGKTTLMGQWHKYLCNREDVSAWLTINEDDAEEKIFNTRLEMVLSLLNRTKSEGDNTRRQYLFLDAYENIAGSKTEKLIRRLCERAGDGLSLVIGTRLETNIGLSRLLLNRQAIEIGSEELKFTQSEMIDGFSVWDMKFNPDQFSAIAKITDGWPAALQFARLALENKRATALGLSKGELTAWADLQEYVFDEIVDNLPSPMRILLNDTAPLGSFTTDMVAEMTGDLSAPSLLSDFERYGLLFRHKNEERRWRSYHPLFAKCIEDQVKIDSPNRLREIHRKAMAWHIEQGRLSDATRHAFAAGDQVTAAELLTQASLERRRLGRIPDSAFWPDKLSDENYDLHPVLRIQAACSLATRLEVEAAKTQIENVRDRYADLDPIVRDDLFAVDSMIAVYGDRPDDAVETSERGLRSCSTKDPYTMGTLKLCGAVGRIAHNDLDKARLLVAEARADNEKADSAFGVAVSHALQGLVRAVSGELVEAEQDWRKAESAIKPVAASDAVEAIAIGYLPELLYEWNDFDGAEYYINKCLASSLEVALPDMIMSVFLTAARTAYARDDENMLNQTLEFAERVGHLRGWPRLVHAIQWERLRVAIRDRNFDKARELHQRIQTISSFIETPGVMTHALEMEADLIGELRFEMTFSLGPSVLARLRAARTQALSRHRNWRAVKLLVLESVAREVMGDNKAAQRCMRHALQLGQKGRLIRTIIDEGPIAVGLVHDVAAMEKPGPESIDAVYLDSVMLVIGEAPISPVEPAFMVEPLSARELDVLKMLASGHSNLDAAQQLFISENTVKWHLQHVYSKLGVKNRTGAIAVARKLDLLR